MTVAGVTLCGLSVGLFNFSGFGMDPFQVFAHGLGGLVPVGYGTFYVALNLLMLVGVFFADRRKIGLGTLANLFLTGYLVQFSSWALASALPAPSLALRVGCLVVGIAVMCFGSSLYFTGDLGVSTYDAVALVLAEKKVGPFPVLRIATDVVCVVVGVLLGATAGIGTVVTAFFMGPVIAFFNRTVAIPLRAGKRPPPGELRPS